MSFHELSAVRQEEVTKALTCLVATQGSYARASKLLKTSGDVTVKPFVIKMWHEEYPALYEQIREKHGPDIERKLTNGLRDVAVLASEATREAVELAHKRIKNGDVDDPARAAASLARVSQSATEKVLTLTNRPTKITETRNAEQIARSLIQQGVLLTTDAPVLEEGGDDEQ